jgi:hypothetical protein
VEKSVEFVITDAISSYVAGYMRHNGGRGPVPITMEFIRNGCRVHGLTLRDYDRYLARVAGIVADPAIMEYFGPIDEHWPQNRQVAVFHDFPDLCSL